ncbi:MAG: hypothetical protein ABI986_00860 [Chloroflexota bacterium]
MNWRHYLILFAIGLAVPFAVSQYQSLPGYMDADYYFAGGIQLATGKGFTEPYIWNYLSDPQSLPTPSHTYWMPLASIVSAIGMWLTSQTSYSAGRLPFILLSACVPILTATLAFDLVENLLIAMVAGLLSIFSMYYAPFMPVPDNYAIFMLLGAAFLLLAPKKQKWIPVALGALGGLMTLARSDGLLWLGLAGLTVMWKSTTKSNGEKNSFKEWISLIVPDGLKVLLGYLIVMGPWHFHIWTLYKSFLTPGGGKLLWLQNYGETFIYPASKLTMDSFLQAGWGVAWQNRMDALVSNFYTAIIAQGGIILVPFILIGLWKLRNELQTTIAVVGWLIVFIVMSVVFPFAGTRGSFHHAGAAMQPLWWVAAPVGLDAILAWVRRRGQFLDKNAPYVFHGTLVVLALAFTIYLINIRVVSTGWAKDDVVYASVEQKLQENGISPMDVVIVPNPPGYYVRTGRSAIRLPKGDQSAVLAVAEKFQARYLILEKSDALGALQSLYDDPQSNAIFVYLGEANNVQIYRINAVTPP